MPEDVNAFNNIDYKNYTKPIPTPDKMTDIDTKGAFYDYLLDTGEQGILDLSVINSFTNISQSRDKVYDLLDLMAEDPTIAAALDIYASDVCEPNDQGKIIWSSSDDPKISNFVDSILDNMNVDKRSYSWVYSLCKYGDLYLRLYRSSDFDVFDTYIRRFKNKDTEALNEDVKVNKYSKNDRYSEYVEMNKNPAEIFDLTKFGKSYGYIKTRVNNNDNISTNILDVPNTNNRYKYTFKTEDVDVFEATEFVHAALEDNSSRDTEEVVLTTEDFDSGISFDIKRGQSILYNAFKIWRELQLLENAVLLNRITKSSIVRIMNVEVGDMESSEVKKLLQRIKMMIEQKSAIKQGTSLTEYTNPGPIENTVYMPVHEGKGAINTQQVGGDVDVGDLTDLDYWKKKLFSAIGIPGQYLGDTDDNTGFNGGTSLSLISSRYAKSIKHIQNIYIQAITDIVNLILLDSGKKDYINKFELHMQQPTTQEEKDRKDNLNTSISVVQNVLSLLDANMEDPVKKLGITKSMLADVLNNQEVIEYIQEEMDRLKEGAPVGEAEGGDMTGGDLGGADIGDLGMGAEDFAPEDSGESEPMDMGGEEGGAEEAPAGEESFYSGRGSSVINERDNLPSFESLGVSYNNI